MVLNNTIFCVAFESQSLVDVRLDLIVNTLALEVLDHGILKILCKHLRERLMNILMGVLPLAIMYVTYYRF